MILEVGYSLKQEGFVYRKRMSERGNYWKSQKPLVTNYKVLYEGQL